MHHCISDVFNFLDSWFRIANYWYCLPKANYFTQNCQVLFCFSWCPL